MLPAQLPSRAHFGTTDPDVFGWAVPITGMAGDQQAAFLGQVCTLPGQAKNTYGTGAFLLAQAGAYPVVSRNRLLTSLGPRANASKPEYLLEGSVFIAGAVVQWLRDELHIVSDSAEIEALAASVPDTGGVTFVPAFAGLGAPYWDPNARGTLLGLTRGTTSAHIARAALEAIALSSVDLLDAMSRDLGSPVTELRVDGGASGNNLLMQMQADFAGIPVIRPANTETTAMGAAYLAGIEAGVWANEAEVATLWTPGRTFEPAMAEAEREQRLAAWRRAVERSRSWATAP
jgi:glycerol kinase